MASNDRDIDDATARAELETLTPPNSELLKWAAESPPPAEWFEGEEEDLF